MSFAPIRHRNTASTSGTGRREPIVPRQLSASALLDFIIAGAIAASLVLLCLEMVANLKVVRAAITLDATALAAVAAAILAYVTAHILRAMRLYLILGIGRIRFRALLGYHAAVAFATLGIPFKLGETVRALELFRLLGNKVRGVFVVWTDRLLDVAMIVAVTVVLVVSGQLQASLIIVLAAASTFLALSVFVLLLLSPALKSWSSILLTSRSPRSLLLLKMCMGARTLLAHFPHIDGPLWALLAGLTFIIWALEFTTVLLLLRALAGGGELAARTADVFAGVLLVSPWVDLPADLALYRLLTITGLLAIVAFAGGQYARVRLDNSRLSARPSSYRLARRQRSDLNATALQLRRKR